MSRSYTSSPPSASVACSGTALPLDAKLMTKERLLPSVSRMFSAHYKPTRSVQMFNVLTL
jgi:hypothetical protein